jgi:hypothetical protein
MKNLRKLTVFENFDPLYPFGYHSCSCHRARMIDQDLSGALVNASLGLETLSGAFMFEARKFFSSADDQIYRSLEWPHLRSIRLTSSLLKSSANKDDIMRMLVYASSAALRMPQLTTMEIWNGDRELAASFQYEFSQADLSARVTWTGTFDLPFSGSFVATWETLASERGSQKSVEWVSKIVNGTIMKCHGDALVQLGLSGTVVRPISVKQIRDKNNFPPVIWEL